MSELTALERIRALLRVENFKPFFGLLVILILFLPGIWQGGQYFWGANENGWIETQKPLLAEGVAYTQTRLGNWQLPHWNPYEESGAPFLSNARQSVFEPFKLVLAPWPLPEAVYWNTLIVLRLLLSGLLMFGFLRMRQISGAGAFVGSLLWVFSSVLLRLSFFPEALAFLLLPGMLYLVERYVHGRRVSLLLPLSALGGLLFLSGPVVSAVWVLLITFVYLALRLYRQHLRTEPHPFALRDLRSGLLALLAAVCLAGIQLVPSFLQWLQYFGLPNFQQWRVQLTMTEGVTAWPDRLMDALLPLDIANQLNAGTVALHTGQLFVGISGLFLIILALLFGYRQKQTWFWTVLAFVSASLVIFLPGLASFVAPLERHGSSLFFLGIFGLAVLGALGADHLLAHFWHWRRRAAVILMLTLIGELYLAHGQMLRFEFYQSLAYEIGAIPRPNLSPLSRHVALQDVEALPQDRWIQIGRGSPQATLSPRLTTWIEAVLQPDNTPRQGATRLPDRLLDSASIRYLLAPDASRFIDGGGKYLTERDPLTGQEKIAEYPYTVHNTDSLTRAYMAYNAIFLGTSQTVMNTLLTPDFDPRRQVTVEAPFPVAELEQFENLDSTQLPATTSATLTRYLPERVDLTVRAEAPGILVLADTYDSNWHATVGEQPRRIFPANGPWRGLYLAAGDQVVSFEYRNHSVYYGLALSLLTLTGLMIWWQRDRRRLAKELTELDETFHQW